MSIDRLTKERLYKDESTFNQLLPYAKYDEAQKVFVHADASIWSVWELSPIIITTTGDEQAFQITQNLQEMLDSMDHSISVQFNWITTFDIDPIIDESMDSYPLSGIAGWLARRWAKAIQYSSRNDALHRRPRRMRLFISFRFDPPWRKLGFWGQIKRTFAVLSGDVGTSIEQRRNEFIQYAAKFRGEIDGKISVLSDMGLNPQRLDGQGLIDLIYPLLNRGSTKKSRIRHGRSRTVPAPQYDPADILSNQTSETMVEHPTNGIIKKDGRVYRTVSMVKPPKRCLPLMLSPLQSAPYEHILSVSFSRDPLDKQIRRLDRLDTTLGFREHTSFGRNNQKITQQIGHIRAAREALYNNSAQIVRVGLHQTFICQNEDEAIRATAEAIASFTSIHGARAMVHEISDMGVMLQSLPGCYDPGLDGAGWSVVLQSTRATRMFPLWGNWHGSRGSLFVLPSLWNKELISFDLFDSNIAPNALISGVSGSGKSYLLCFLLIQLNRGHYSKSPDGKIMEKPPITFIFDKGMPNQPCGFDKLARAFDGRIYEATPSKAPAMNFLARLGRMNADAQNEDFKDLLDISADIVLDMATEGDKKITRVQRNDVIMALLEAHRLYRNGPQKREFLLSDLIAVLRAPQKVNEDQESAARRHEMVILLADYYGEGTYARFFDRQGGLKLQERFIVFDLKGLNRNPDLRRIFLKVAMLWADEVMNDPNELDTRKVLVFDEAHDLIGKTSAGVVESAFRLYRKRKGMVIAASQSGEDFYTGEGGQAIVQNSAHKIFLRQDPSKFPTTAKAFNLSDQQADIIMRLRTIMGVESQFYMVSDIGEAALTLPVEPCFYWISTNNGDDNQLFNRLLEEEKGNFWNALFRAIQLAPFGATYKNQAPTPPKPEESDTAFSEKTKLSRNAMGGNIAGG